ncbi:hypothetical protein WMY93_006830 [Mugilogobius chulae]|uniref:Reverse transcriptase n=1 Tax=Mugilogobius chulae TaxID=88201 RepID=A0AAW0PKT8_9GOBI
MKTKEHTTQSTVYTIIHKWKEYGTTANLPRPGRTLKLTVEQGENWSEMQPRGPGDSGGTAKIYSSADTPQCPLCQKAGSLEHILSCCPRALADGRYRWRHDQVLKAIADAITSGIISSKHQQPTKLQITFVKAGEKPHQRREKGGALLASARDWQLKVDLGKQLKFPESIAETTLRPDMVLLSETTRQVLLLELTVPWEDRIEEAFERKRAKYRELVDQCRSQGWQARCNPIEVGCRGFAGQSLVRTLKLLGVRGLQAKKAIKNITDAAEKASRWLWIKRGDPWISHATQTQVGT